MPIIPTTWEAENGKTVVQGELGQKVSDNTLLSQSISWVWWHIPVIPANVGGHKYRRSMV
jgi:hypothetical protein